MNHLWKVNIPTNHFPRNIALVVLRIGSSLTEVFYQKTCQCSEIIKMCLTWLPRWTLLRSVHACLLPLLSFVVGGSEPFRCYWEMYLSKGLLLVFVVDSADHKRLPEAKKYLHQLIGTNPVLPLVVFANKQVKNLCKYKVWLNISFINVVNRNVYFLNLIFLIYF